MAKEQKFRGGRLRLWSRFQARLPRRLKKIGWFLLRPFLLPVDLLRLSVDSYHLAREAEYRARTGKYPPCMFCSKSAGESPRPVPRGLRYANLWVFRFAAPCVHYPTRKCNTPHCVEPNLHKRPLRHLPLTLLLMGAGWCLVVSGSVVLYRSVPRDLGMARIAQAVKGSPAEPETGARGSARAERYFKDARAHVEKGELDKARVAFANATREAPKRADIRLESGRVLLQLGRGQDALQELRRAVLHDPKLAEAHMELAWIYLLGGQRGVAAKHLDEADKHPPEQKSHLHLLRAQMLLAEGQKDEAFTSIILALQEDEVEIGHLNRAGRLMLGLNRPDQAEKIFAKLLELNPQDVQGRIGKASCHLMRGELEPALEGLNDVARAAPDHPELLLLRAELDAIAGRIDDAKAGYRNILRRTPEMYGAQVRLAEILVVNGEVDEGRMLAVELSEDPRPRASIKGHLLLARIYLLNRFYSESIRHGRQVLARDPDQQAARLLVARALHAQDKFPEAIVELKQVLLRAPDRLDALNQLAAAQIAAGDDAAGVATWRDAVARHPGERAPLLSLAHHFFRSRRYAEALPLYRQYFETHPDDAAAANNVAMSLVELKRDLDEAHELAEQVLRRYPDNPLFMDAYGWVLLAQGRTEESLTYLLKAAKALPRSPRTQFHLGAAYLQLGDEAQARRQFETSLALSGQFEHAEEARQRLAVLRETP